ncbi:MAG: bifunctional oligoribonuclease/PAP phosphatase NrnA [Clostridiales bacterium]|nr:bifunctional oligoribonuclease/PAP phosphatase NrnA [Clostridiales bacterium]
MIKLRKIADRLLKSQKIALICHINPDGDTVGSALALYRALTKLGKKADIFCSDEISDKLKYLPFSDRFNVNRETKYDVAAAIDCGDRGRLGLMSEIFDGAAAAVCVDHHKSNSIKCDDMYVDPLKASTAEIVYSLIKMLADDYEKMRNKGKGLAEKGAEDSKTLNSGKGAACDCAIQNDGNGLIDKDIATLIYAGILTDTGMFSYSLTSAETHKIAAELYGYGIAASDIAYNVFKKQAMSAFLLAHRALAKTRFFMDGKIGVVSFFLKDFEETGSSPDHTEGLVNSVQTVEGVLAAIALTEIDPTHFRVSIRTKTPVDAAAIAGEFGGGGHTLAAGCRLQGSYEEITERLVKAAGDRIYR